jgi:hypothetical protein
MTNHTAGADETRSDQEPLGTMLVRRGLITQEQLTDALAEQKASGEPLGKIVVARGFAAPATIAQALATQHGGLLKTEYGFATGFGSPLQSPVAISAPPAMISAPPVTSAARTARASSAAVVAPAPVAPVEADSLRGELAHASAETERLRADNERLAQVRADLETRLAGESRRASSLERELELAKESGSADEASRIATLEAEVAARDAAIEEFKQTGEGWKNAIVERDAAIADLVKARDEALAKAGTAGAEAEPVDVAAFEATIAELKAERASLEERLAAAESATPDNSDTKALEAKLDELTAARDEALALLRTTKAELAELDAKLPAVTEQRDAALARIQELERTAEADRALLAVHDTAVADLVAGHEAALEELRAQAAATATATDDRWAAAERHLLFFSGSEGYELVERAGPPPSAGDRVDVPGGPQLVARVAASPTPGRALPCAYLAA